MIFAPPAESSSPPVTLIGFDCSTNPKKAGLARGVWGGGRAAVIETRDGAADPAGTIADWLDARPAGAAAVVAFDAPLGWPAALGPALAGHAAGDPLPHGRDRLFRRATDDFVHRTVGKRPLDVGADRIARTAAFACGVAGRVRARTPLPLAAAAGVPAGGGAVLIEVYPAASLLSRGLDLVGYKAKGPGGEAKRSALLDRLAGEADFPADRSVLVASDDAFDAAVCVLAAADFAAGRVHPPPPNFAAETLRTEGWIWFGPPAG